MSEDQQITDLIRELVLADKYASDAHEKAEEIRARISTLEVRVGRPARPPWARSVTDPLNRLQRILTIEVNPSIPPTGLTLDLLDRSYMRYDFSPPHLTSKLHIHAETEPPPPPENPEPRRLAHARTLIAMSNIDEFSHSRRGPQDYTFFHRGLHCMVLEGQRGALGNYWLGYVGIKEGHPIYGGTPGGENSVSVWGGINWANVGAELNVPDTLRGDWYLGFDTLHHTEPNVVWNRDIVIAEVIGLADQLVEMGTLNQRTRTTMTEVREYIRRANVERLAEPTSRGGSDFIASGLHCILVPTSLADGDPFWHGYVGVPRGHGAYAKTAEELREYTQHGGIKWTGYGHLRGVDTLREDDWYIGLDLSHDLESVDQEADLLLGTGQLVAFADWLLENYPQ